MPNIHGGLQTIPVQNIPGLGNVQVGNDEFETNHTVYPT